MKPRIGIRICAFIEILIGTITWLAVMISLIQDTNTKPLGVLVFVLLAGLISIVLGWGLLRHNLTCYYLLLYFSSVIILSKILIFAKVISLHGALETMIPAPLKDTVSIAYHGFIVFYFTRIPVRKHFEKK